MSAISSIGSFSVIRTALVRPSRSPRVTSRMNILLQRKVLPRWKRRIKSLEPACQGGHRRFHSKNAGSEPDRAEPGALQGGDFLVDEPPFRTDGERYRPALVSRTILLRIGVRDECLGALGDRRQLLFDNGAEEAPQLDVRHHGVPRLLQPEDGLLPEVFRRESGALPVALVDAPRIDEKKPLDSQGGHGRHDAIHHLRPGQRENECDAGGRWRRRVEDDGELDRFPVDASNHALANLSAGDTDDQLFADGGAVDAEDVIPAPSPQTRDPLA